MLDHTNAHGRVNLTSLDIHAAIAVCLNFKRCLSLAGEVVRTKFMLISPLTTPARGEVFFGELGMLEFNWNDSYEYLADMFRKETGMMAPAKDAPYSGYSHEERSKAWAKFMDPISSQAWSDWHKNHGMHKNINAHNHWRESLTNCMNGDSYLKPQEWQDLIDELDYLYNK